MERRVDVIVNCLAHGLSSATSRRDRRGVFGGLEEALAASPARGSRGALHLTASMSDLTGAITTLKERGTDCVVLAGGDGSYMAGTTALLHALGDALPPIAFAPGGTVCTVGRNWAPRGDYGRRYARRLVTQALAGEAVTTLRPTLRVRDDRGGDRIGFIFGAGLIARFFDAYYESETLGVGSAARLVARIFAGTFTSGALARRVLTPGPARIVVDGQQQGPRAWSLIAASVVKDLGLHMHLLHRAAESTSAFHFVASPLPPRALSPQVGRVLLGRGLRGEGNVDALAREVSLSLSSHEEGSADSRRSLGSTYVLDGDRIAASTVTVTPGPVLRYVSPTA